MKTFYFLLFLFSCSAQGDDWFCKSQSSIRRGDSFIICGVATEPHESESRIQALKNAQEEFNSICQNSDDCAGKPVEIHPARTDCAPLKEGVRCYREVIYAVSGGSTRPGGQGGSRHLLSHGIHREELIERAGYPDHILEYRPGEYGFAYRGELCVYANDLCWVDVSQGLVSGFNHVKPQYLK